ncbi:ABC transporter permease [Cutibacterium avidum]|uniref:ABC transporter permease n=1 Tax=Cutibacterium avidum TaxID=33010 RepID=UPI002093103F|nr:FtsX-like permease family protein [Cutibacterium avidum]MCO6664888.1 ABC transporter permease [Cutibacterium avidum]
MWKATFTSLWSRKLRLFMSTLAIVLGVAFVSGSFVFGDMLRSTFNSIVSGSVSDVEVSKNTEDAVQGDVTKPYPLTPAVVDRIRTVDGVKDAQGTVTETGTVLIDRDGKAITSFGPPQLGFSWQTTPALGGQQGVHVVSGHEPRTDDEVVVDPQTLDKSGHHVGDRVKVITSRAGTVQAKLVGTATVGQSGSAGASYVFFTTHRAQQLFLKGHDAFTGVATVVEPGADRATVAKAVQKVLPKGYQAKDGKVVADEQMSAIGKALGFVDIFLLVFAGISLLVASFLIVNTFTILVAQRSSELALYRAMGASRGQIRATVLVEALVVGAVGSVLGLFGGLGLAVAIKAIMAATGWDIGQTTLTLGVKAIVASLITGILVTLVAALLPAARATRISPVQAMTSARTESEVGLGKRAVIGSVMATVGVVGIVVGVLDVVPKPVAWAGAGMALTMIGVALASPLLGRPVIWIVGKVYRATFSEVGKLAELNSIRQPRRTAATASALMIGLTLVSLMAVFGASSTRSVTSQVTDTLRGDFMVGRQGFEGFPDQVRTKVAAVPQVKDVHAMKMAQMLEIPAGQATPPKEYFTDAMGRHMRAIAGMEATSLDKMFPQKVTKGRMFHTNGEMIVDEKTAEKYHLKVGSSYRLWSVDAQRPMTLTVVGIYTTGKGQPIATMWVSTSTLTSAGLGDKDAFLSIYLKAGTDHEQAHRALDAALADMPLVSVMDVGQYTDQVLVNVNRTMALLYALLGLSIVIAVLGIVNTLGLSIIERTRELGLLRAIALTRPQVRRMITLESVVIALLGAVVGVGLGTVFGMVLQRLLADRGIDKLSIPWLQLVAFLVAAALVGVLAALWPARRAARTNILKAIATE